MNNKILNDLYEEAKVIYKDEPTGHDFSHIERVLDFCRAIQEQEGGDKFILEVSVLLHDVHRVLSNIKGVHVSAEESVPFVEEILNKYNISPSTKQKILTNIENHENKGRREGDSLELLILKDADILDALGEIGLKRTLTYCKTRHIPIADPNYPLSAKEYVPNTFPISTTHYVYRTMIPDKDKISTETGKKLAKHQIQVLLDFVNKNIKEYNLKVD